MEQNVVHDKILERRSNVHEPCIALHRYHTHEYIQIMHEKLETKSMLYMMIDYIKIMQMNNMYKSKNTT